MTRRRIIVGAGGFGREVRDLIDARTDLEVVGFLDDRRPDDGSSLGGTYLGPIDGDSHLDVPCLVAIGYPRPRQLAAEKLSSVGRGLAPSFIHEATTIGTDVRFGEGCIVTAGVVATTAIRCGRLVTLHPGCLLGHDVTIEDLVAVMPGAAISGNVHLGTGAFVGTNATIVQGLTVGAWATIGAGAVVTRDVVPGTTVVGVPARAVT